MTTGEKLTSVAMTDATFRRDGPLWVGKCLICNGPVAFDARTGDGATLEHIRARTRSGAGDPANLGVAHGRCNGEKGRNWDRKRRKPPEEYDAFVARLLARRLERWRDAPPAGFDQPPGPAPFAPPRGSPPSRSGSSKKPRSGSAKPGNTSPPSSV